MLSRIGILAFVFLLLLGSFAWLVPSTSSAEKAASTEKPKSAPARKTTATSLRQPLSIELLSQPSGDGNARVLRGNEQRGMSIDASELRADAQRYADALQATNQVFVREGREYHLRTRPAFAARALRLEPGRAEELPQFVGLPALPPNEQQDLINNSLMITELGVVEDPERTTGDGHWTFGHLMTQVANRGATGIDPSTMVRRWLHHWEEDQTVNGFTVPKRMQGIQQKIIQPWEQASGGSGHSLDLTKAPFRLLAIVNRVDLRDDLVQGPRRIGGGGAGEARFVFCAIDTQNGKPLPFTVIFEYQIKRKNFHDLRHWARQWYALKNLHLGTTSYRKALQAITDQFTEAEVDPETVPNRSALSQLRTNEIALAGPWELREFRLDANNTGYFKEVTVKQAPDLSFNNQAVLASFINMDEDDILGKEHRVPVEFPSGTHFLGGASPAPVTPAQEFFWNAAGIQQPDARQLFSLNTCNACHTGETFPKFTTPDNLDLDQIPPHFTHVRPRMAGHEARLSPFLTGANIPDPSGQVDGNGHVVVRPFNDLARRANELRGLVEFGLIYEQARSPLNMVH